MIRDPASFQILPDTIVAELKAEQALVAANRELIPASRKKSKPRWRVCGARKRPPPSSLAWWTNPQKRVFYRRAGLRERLKKRCSMR